MVRVLGLLLRFKRDESGVFAVIFGLMAIVLIAFGGAVVDYVAVEQNRGRAQIALDAAALALQPKIYTTGVTRAVLKANLQAQAQALMLDRLGTAWGVTASIIDTQIDTDEGSLYFRAAITVPTMFVSLVGVKQLDAQIQSEATRKKLALEIAFVLDNSGSMSYTGAGTKGTRQRIQFLKDAATCATYIMFYKDVVDSTANPDTCLPASGAPIIDNVSIGVVPFNMLVNVGATNNTASWLDKAGTSITANDNFDNDDDDATPGPPTVNRFGLFSATTEAWRGCVEARPHIKSGTSSTEYLDTDDTASTSANGLYVPMFSPDLVDGVGGNSYVADSPAICDRPTTGNANCTVKRRRTSCNAAMSNSSCTNSETILSSAASGTSTNFTSTQKIAAGYYYGAHAASCDCRTWSTNTWTQTAGGTSSSNRTFEITYTCQGGGYVPTNLTNRELQERMCKYYSPLTATAFAKGPNAECVRTPILPLTSTPSTVTTTINGMTAEGGTNIHEGAAWGFRALSPTQPFDQGGPYNEATSKVMILMTDGENTAYNLPPTFCGTTQINLNGNCFYSAYGFPYNSKNTDANSSSAGNIERLGNLGASNATLVTQMNERTRQTCENAKAKGITIYTIGLATADADQSTQAEVEDMLADCASTRDKAYFPQEPRELKSVFQAIANDLTALRIAL